tara:strand:- start:184 stop:852 length:669 start_codon:yes stop_codon:yes gene_type:complete
MEAKEINITYETLYETLKRERDISDLQKLDPTFFAEFVNYLNEKEKLLEKDDSLFSYDEKKKVEKQIDNAKRIIKEIYERREKKILYIALIKSRTKSNVIDMSSFMENEKKFFNEVVSVLDSFRAKIIDNVMVGKPLSKIVNETKGKEVTTEEKPSTVNGTKGEKRKSTKLVRFLYSVPKFVGKELEEYGPFVEEDVASLPTEIAELLLSKGRVEEIQDSSQ